MFGITAVSVVSGIVIYLVSQSTRKGKTDERADRARRGRARDRGGHAEGLIDLIGRA